MTPSLWHDFIHKKYLKHKYVVEWIREWRKNLKEVSNYSKALTSSLQIIIDWIAWNPGNGRDIHIGLHPFMRSQSY
jgi:hypothetical protein